MQLPNRKPGKYTFAQFDPNMTQDKFDALSAKLDRLKTVSQPAAIKDVKRLGENGDFSENAEYQIAKGRLRGINRGINEIQRQLDKAIIIKPSEDTTTVQLGHKVTISTAGTEKTFRILGPTETDPEKGIISFKSPLGEALMDKKVGDVVEIRDVEYKILRIE
ncbi:GreA/GreB family elongation factor [Patescibacteria group bacterium]|nr:GreA/GreB family elongation factor [Patescibacteria group bacterium]MBU1673822.1 GreA/GreB family elongation factor [Patescibacteria group bacterium]MBU1964069.1 GreA/GreB family elongation factor [Patescibacteria group bacterium]